ALWLRRVMSALALLVAGSPALAGPVDETSLADIAVSHPRIVLWNAWSKVDRPTRIAWARRFLLEGGTVAVAAPLVSDIWTDARKGTDAEAATARRDAVVLFFYGYLRFRIDGQFCRDPSSPGDLLFDYVTDLKPVADFAAGLPADTIRALAGTAATLEARSADTRGNDKYLCSRGRMELGSDVFLAREIVESLAGSTRNETVAELKTFGSRR
ncbi:hypothetical protein WDZ92_43955, partial [Nostoc sp. NIES-2111]